MTCATVAVADALEFSEGGFDRILLDPPCSGLGVLAGTARCPLAADARRTPATWRACSGGCSSTPAACSPPDGRLVYSVCTIRRDECTGVVPGGRQTLPHRDHTDGFYIAVAA